MKIGVFGTGMVGEAIGSKLVGLGHCGDDAEAKREVSELLESFGWPAERIRDLGGIVAARGTEMYVTLWLSLYGKLGTGAFNIAVVA